MSRGAAERTSGRDGRTLGRELEWALRRLEELTLDSGSLCCSLSNYSILLLLQLLYSCTLHILQIY